MAWSFKVRQQDWKLEDYFQQIHAMPAQDGRGEEVWTCCDGWPPGTSAETHEAIWVSRSGAIYEGTHFGWRDTFIRAREEMVATDKDEAFGKAVAEREAALETGDTWEVVVHSFSDAPPVGCGWEPFAATAVPDYTTNIWWRRRMR